MRRLPKLDRRAARCADPALGLELT